MTDPIYVEAAGLYVDLKKAFDNVDHAILLAKLENYGIKGWYYSGSAATLLTDPNTHLQTTHYQTHYTYGAEYPKVSSSHAHATWILC